LPWYFYSYFIILCTEIYFYMIISLLQKCFMKVASLKYFSDEMYIELSIFVPYPYSPSGAGQAFPCRQARLATGQGKGEG
jgi:hypothetical protein